MVIPLSRSRAVLTDQTDTDPAGDSILPPVLTATDRERKLSQITEDDGRRYELINGEEVVSPSPIPDHQRALRTVIRLIDPFVVAHDLGEIFPSPIDVRLDEFGVFVPDLVFVAKERAAIVGDRRIEGAPDLVVEILSPSTRRDDLGRKFVAYARAGVREYWLVDLASRRLAIWELIEGRFVRAPTDDDGLLRSRVLAGLAIDIPALFADMLPRWQRGNSN